VSLQVRIPIMTKTLFGQVFDSNAGDAPVYEVTIRSEAGAEAKILSWGAVIRDLVVPWQGKGQRVVLGLDRFEDYIAHSQHLGALAGRFANRIRDGRFTLDGKSYQLERNFLGKHALHGGKSGFGIRAWQLAHHDEHSVTLVLVSPDGDGGFPGQMTVTCRYSFEEPATLRADLTATTDAPTIVNLALHSYFNLDGSADILDHEATIDAEFISSLDQELIPTGEFRSVEGTRFDFRKPRPIRGLDANGRHIPYDQNFLLATRGHSLRHAATVASKKNGLSLAVWTTEPCIQFYDAVNLRVPVAGLGGQALTPHSGFCLEPQHMPDSPNRPHFTDTTLRPGEIYRQTTEYRFG
jgi:aldose 1-epimerase